VRRPRRIAPGPGQESVWDYPRPPRVEPCRRTARVEADGVVVAGSTRALRVLETAGPPTIYFPPDDVDMDLLSPAPGRSTYCEWKGRASYYDVAGRKRAAWTYLDPKLEFAELTRFISFYPAKLECFLDDEPVRSQPGRFYGGWVTDDIVGPFKGEPGSLTW
jgi:uncharacterized protein (DUF427 family)